MTYALRTAGDPLAYVQIVRAIVREADSSIPVSSVITQAAEIDRTISREITFARLCTGFAILALLTACVGLYGAMSYSVRASLARWAAAVLLAAAILAGYVPARRASRIEPLVALRPA